jgi:glycosyltransferase involved in cell wall biosynthesis
MRRVLVYAANLSVGGGVQVATSFIDEASRLAAAERGDLALHVCASSEIAENLSERGADVGSFASYEVIDSAWVAGRPARRYLASVRPDAVFAVFGPVLLGSHTGRTVMGFAQPSLIYRRPHPDDADVVNVRHAASPAEFAKRMIFSRADHLVVEMPRVKRGVIAAGIKRSGDDVSVVQNCIGSVFSDPPAWGKVPMPHTPGMLRIGYLGRDYPHKNTEYLALLGERLDAQWGIKSEIFVTFTGSEWARKSPRFRARVHNIGPLRIAQAPSFYAEVDVVVFPSLLECFSVTPLEAMLMRRPLFASNRAFVRDVCGEHARYIDPFDPNNGAAELASYSRVAHSPAEIRRLDVAAAHASAFTNSRGRALAYLDLIRRFT